MKSGDLDTVHRQEVPSDYGKKNAKQATLIENGAAWGEPRRVLLDKKTIKVSVKIKSGGSTMTERRWARTQATEKRLHFVTLIQE